MAFLEGELASLVVLHRLWVRPPGRAGVSNPVPLPHRGTRGKV